MNIKINSIVAMCSNKGIGLNNTLPWKCKEDLLYFKKLTIGEGNNAIVMGKNTYKSIGILPRRHNFILSSTLNFSYVKNNYLVKTFISIDELLKFINNNNYDNLWVIGGSQIYKSFLNKHLIDLFYITYIDKQFECDTFMCQLPNYYLKLSEKISSNKFDDKHSIYYIIFKKIIKNMKLIYKNNHICIVKDIHFDNLPDIYFTIEYDNKECQTEIHHLSIYKN